MASRKENDVVDSAKKTEIDAELRKIGVKDSDINSILKDGATGKQVADELKRVCKTYEKR